MLPYVLLIEFLLSNCLVRLYFTALDDNIESLFTLHTPERSFIGTQTEITFSLALWANNVRHYLAQPLSNII